MNEQTMEPKVKKVLRKVAALIIKHSRQFNMGDWFCTSDFVGRKATRCGTSACIAGWMAFVLCKANKLSEVRDLKWSESITVAIKFLAARGYYTDCLFYVSSWPQPFNHDYRAAKTAKHAAKVAAARIKHFIDTNGE